MELTHSQISEILSNYTSSSEGFVTLQSLINVSVESTSKCKIIIFFCRTRILAFENLVFVSVFCLFSSVCSQSFCL